MQVVCVIDDEPSIRKSVANLLKSAGLRPVCFDSGERFLASTWKVKAACVLLDMRMQGLQGHDVQLALRAEGNRVPVICMSAHANEQLKAWAFSEGATEFLTKPFSAEALLSAITTALEHRT